VEKTVEKIIKLLKDNPQIFQRELANITGLTQRGIEWNISKLKDSGQLERIGPDKGGHWKVLK
jgi:ATP-dependent DNA helicase RecG